MAADLKIVVSGYDAAMAKLTALSKGYDELAKKAIDAQKKASKERLSTVAEEVQQARDLYKSVKQTLGPAKGGGRSGGSGGGSGGGSDAGSAIAGGVAAGAALGAVGIAAGALKSALGLAVDGLKSFGSFLLSDVFKPQLKLEKAATQLQNASGGQVKSAEVMSRANAAQLRWNIDANDAATVMADVMDQTGRVDLAFGKFEDLAKLMKAYGGEAREYAGVVAAIASYDPTASAETILTMVKQITAAGQVTGGKFTGAVQARAGGAQFGALPFIGGGSIADKVASSNALMQFAGIQGKYEETITAQFALISDAIRLSNKGTLQGPVVTKEGTVDTEKMIEAVLRKTLVKNAKGKEESKADVLKRIEMSEPAQKMAGQMQIQFANILKTNGGNVDAAIKQMLASFRAFRDAQVDEAKINEDAASVMETASERWETAMNGIKAKLLEVMPKFTSLVDNLVLALPGLGDALTELSSAILDAAIWIAEKTSADPEVTRQLKHQREIKELDTKIAKTAEEDTKAKLIKQKEEKESLYSKQTEAINALVGTSGATTEEEKKKAYEKAMKDVDEVFLPTMEERLSTELTGGEMESTVGLIDRRVMRGNYTPEQGGALRQYVSEVERSQEGASSELSPAAYGLDPSKTNAAQKQLEDLGESAAKTKKKLDALGDTKIPTGPIGGGANGGKK